MTLVSGITAVEHIDWTKQKRRNKNKNNNNNEYAAQNTRGAHCMRWPTEERFTFIESEFEMCWVRSNNNSGIKLTIRFSF